MTQTKSNTKEKNKNKRDLNYMNSKDTGENKQTKQQVILWDTK